LELFPQVQIFKCTFTLEFQNSLNDKN